jgi:hypothetical protein
MQGRQGRKLLLIEHVSHIISDILLKYQIHACLFFLYMKHFIAKFKMLSPTVSYIEQKLVVSAPT